MSNKIVALDLGSSHLRALEAEVKNNQPRIIKVYSMGIPSGVMESGEIKDEEELSTLISELWKKGGFKAKKVIVAANGSPLQLRLINRIRSGQTDEDLKNIIPFVIRDYVPFDSDDYHYDFHTLSERRDPDDLMIYKRILLTAISKDYVDSLVNVLTKNKLRLAALDAAPLALIRAHHIAYDDYKPGNVVASIDIGAETLTISFHKNHQPVHNHVSMTMGGNRITERIARELKITFPEAELLKVTSGLPDDEIRNLSTTVILPNGSTRISAIKDFTPEQKEQIADIISEETANIIEHINDILDDFFANTNETTVNEMVFSGGGVMLNSLVKRAAAEFKISMRIAKIKSFEASKKKLGKEIINTQHQLMTILGVMVSRNEY